MKTFSQLKRDLHTGVKVKTILNNCKPEKNGQIREILKTQSNAIVFKDETTKSGESWLWYAKASNYEYEDNIVKVYDDPHSCNNYTRELLFVYEIMGA